MRRLKDQVVLADKFETITMNDLRSRPGEVMLLVEMGKIFLITRGGKPVGVLSGVPGTTLTLEIDPKGKVSYSA